MKRFLSNISPSQKKGALVIILLIILSIIFKNPESSTSGRLLEKEPDSSTSGHLLERIFSDITTDDTTTFDISAEQSSSGN